LLKSFWDTNNRRFTIEGDLLVGTASGLEFCAEHAKLGGKHLHILRRFIELNNFDEKKAIKESKITITWLF
jgi:hypothetical protein